MLGKKRAAKKGLTEEVAPVAEPQKLTYPELKDRYQVVSNETTSLILEERFKLTARVTVDAINSNYSFEHDVIAKSPRHQIYDRRLTNVRSYFKHGKGKHDMLPVLSVLDKFLEDYLSTKFGKDKYIGHTLIDSEFTPKTENLGYKEEGKVGKLELEAVVEYRMDIDLSLLKAQDLLESLKKGPDQS